MLAVLVVLFHITKFVFLGHFAVLCFFMLSGYWITYMYDAKYKAADNAVVSFYLSRLWRLLPVYVLLNAVALGLAHYYNGDLASYTAPLSAPGKLIFWFSNVFILSSGLFPKQVLSPAWSLDVELQFYLLFPLLFAVLTRLERYLTEFSGVLLLLIISVSLLSPELVIAKTVVIYLPYFLIGSVIYFGNISFSKKTELVFNSAFLLVLGVNYLFASLREETIYHHLSSYNQYLNNYLPLLLIPLLSNSVRVRTKSRLDSVLGDMSYVLYLTHWVVLIPYLHYMSGQDAKVKLLYTAVYLVLTFGLSYLIYLFYDKPIDRLRRKWTVNKASLQLA